MPGFGQAGRPGQFTGAEGLRVTKQTCRQSSSVQRISSSRIHAAARTCSSVSAGDRSTNCDAEAPSSRFSDRAAMGTRIVLNTQAPLTHCRCGSAAGQEDQPIIACILPSAQEDGERRASAVQRPSASAGSWVSPPVSLTSQALRGPFACAKRVHGHLPGVRAQSVRRRRSPMRGTEARPVTWTRAPAYGTPPRAPR